MRTVFFKKMISVVLSAAMLMSVPSPVMADTNLSSVQNSASTSDVASDDTQEKNGQTEILTTAANGINVTVYARKGILPDGTSVKAEVKSEKTDNYEKVIDSLNKEVDSKVLSVLDISLINSKGEEFEPDDDVTVEFGGSYIRKYLNADKSLSVYHVTDDKVNSTGSNAKKSSFDNLDVQTSDKNISVTTDSFSDYVLVLDENHKDSSPQKEHQLNDHLTFETNKYLSDPTGTKNGQNTYNLTIEAAVYDSEPPVTTKVPAPDRREIIMAVDQSASMIESGKVENACAGMQTFLRRIASINAERKANYDAGLYTLSSGDTIANHYIYVNSVIGYNNYSFDKYHPSAPTAPLTQEDADKIYNAIVFYPHYRKAYSGPDWAADSYVIGGQTIQNNEANASHFCMDGTRTDLALRRAKSYISSGKEKQTDVILITDGEPFMYGDTLDDHSDDYHNVWYTYGRSTPKGTIAWTVPNVDDCLSTARSMKDSGVTIYGIYDYANKDNIVKDAYASKDVTSLKKYEEDAMGLEFMSLVSSDYPKNGGWEHDAASSSTDVHKMLHTYNFTSGTGAFGNYVYYPNTAVEITNAYKTIAAQMAVNKNKGQSYAGATSYIYDVISDPFTLNGGQANLKVYKVPRIKKIADDSDVDEDDAKSTVKIGDPIFKWDYKQKADITDEVAVTVSANQTIKISGFDYEGNAVTSFNKSGSSETLPSKPGDYGYKLVVEFPIEAHFTFGGNQIQTNNNVDTVSGFYPSIPTGYTDEAGTYHNAEPIWENNTAHNPQKKNYIELLPVPKVDLNVNYKIVHDDMTIYAPQTAKIKNIVTDADNNIFYKDADYANLESKYDTAKTAYDIKAKAYENAQTQYAANAISSSEMLKVQEEYQNAQSALQTAKRDLDNAANYIPDGTNNQFVNIHYSLKDPSGTEIGTLDVPHGTAYTGSNLKWSFTGGDDANLTKSGKYTIECTVTPVQTTKGTGSGQTPTGSSGVSAGHQQARTFTEYPQVKIFTIEVTGVDTRLVPDQTIDLSSTLDTATNMQTSYTGTQDKHIINFKWVSDDGSVSNASDEPGTNPAMKVGSSVAAKLTVPEAAASSIGVKGGETVVKQNDDKYTPVVVIVSRAIGNLNKDVSVSEQTSQTTKYLRDDDHLYGDRSSISWKHVCTEVDDCDANEFKDAQKYSKDATINGQNVQEKVRFLIHVESNPLPNITKSTSTPAILKGNDIKWKVGIKNDSETDNPNHLQSSFYSVDVLPYVGDKRDDVEQGTAGSEVGSKFGGSLKYTAITIDTSSASGEAARLQSGADYLQYTIDKKARTAELSGSTSDLDTSGWVTMAPDKVDGTDVSYYNIPSDAVAVRLKASLKWNNAVTLNMTANVTNIYDQQVKDYYLNQALVYNDTNGTKLSEVVKTVVRELYISGTVWKDANANGLQDSSEKHVEKTVVNLYTTDSSSRLPAAATIDGTTYYPAIDNNGDIVPAVLTTDDGNYIFSGLNGGTYTVVATDLPDNYKVTAKNAGSDRTIDSDADAVESVSNAAIIRNINLNGTSPVEHMDIGIIYATGDIVVNKHIDTISYPPDLTPEQKHNYQVNIGIQVRNTATGKTYSGTIQMQKDASGNNADGSIKFSDLPVGTYTVAEVRPAGSYKALEPKTELDNTAAVTFPSNGTANVNLTADKNLADITFTNQGSNVLLGDDHSAQNHIPMRMPVSLDVTYSGPADIRSNTVTSRTFTQNDFKDIVVTYDDGSTAKLSDGSLKFDQLTLSPKKVTNMMNSGKSDAGRVIEVYYTEKGRTLNDTFRVQVHLAGIYKFGVTFDANGSSFSGGGNTNSVKYGFNIETGSSYKIYGTYKDPNAWTGRNFTGWNTQQNASGVQYAPGEDAMNVIGSEKRGNQYLYATYNTTVTFDANGGSGGRWSRDEKLYQRPFPDQTPSRSGYVFLGWNTSNDGGGTWIDNYGGLTGPVTFYAIWMAGTYNYVGSNDFDAYQRSSSDWDVSRMSWAQMFTAPISGTYRVTLVGGQGGLGCGQGKHDSKVPGSLGDTVVATVYLSKGQNVQVYVGGYGCEGHKSRHARPGGWGDPNGGYGIVDEGDKFPYSGGNGGCTSIRINGNRVAMAAGGLGGMASGKRYAGYWTDLAPRKPSSYGGTVTPGTDGLDLNYSNQNGHVTFEFISR